MMLTICGQIATRLWPDRRFAASPAAGDRVSPRPTSEDAKGTCLWLRDRLICCGIARNSRMGAYFQHSDEPPEAPRRRRLGRLMRVHHVGRKLRWSTPIAMTTLLLSAAAFWGQSYDRIWEHRDRAWRAVQTPGNTGKIEPLEYLNREDGLGCFNGRCLIVVAHREELTGTDLSAVYLTKVELPGADLRRANLRGADLTEANLSGADLTEADLRGAKLTKANLSGAKLVKANLVEAYLLRANLSGSDLSGANLTDASLLGTILTHATLDQTDFSGADLAAVVGLNHEYLASACGDRRTLLPPSLIVHACQ